MNCFFVASIGIGFWVDFACSLYILRHVLRPRFVHGDGIVAFEVTFCTLAALWHGFLWALRRFLSAREKNKRPPSDSSAD